jgi:hypothetical protein
MTTAEAQDARDGTSRRRLLTAGVSGAALAALVAGRAAAQTEGGATTTAAPKRPTTADEALLVAAQAAELAAFELYDSALGGDAFEGDDRATIAGIRQHHDAYAEALGGLLGRGSTSDADEAVVEQYSSGFDGSSAASVALAAHGLERTLVATHTALLAELDGTDGAGLIASILVVEARHIPVLASLAGLDPASDLDAFVGQNDATPL